MENAVIVDRLKRRALELRYMRREGFEDTHIDSKCIIHEIKFLFNMLTDNEKDDILNKPWLDE